jgi:four helix bundle protein
MGAKLFSDLRCWQFCRTLKVRVYAITATLPASTDVDFCSQIRRSARSAPRNIAEGFGRFTHREMSQYLKIALGSLAETQDGLIDALDQGYITKSEFDDLWALSLSAIRTTKAFKRSIDEAAEPRDW